MYAAFNAARDQSGVLQHAQMLRHRDARHGEGSSELRHHRGPRRETLEQGPACAVGEGVENRIEPIIAALVGTFAANHVLIMKPNGDIFKCSIPLPAVSI